VIARIGLLEKDGVLKIFFAVQRFETEVLITEGW
jgi:hypothetical protein